MRICVVDENQLVRGALQEFLTELGHAVVSVCENRELLGVLHMSEQLPGLIIAECRCGCAGNADELRQIHRLVPDTPIIATIDRGILPDTREAISHGIYAFLRKPLHLSELELMLIRLSENHPAVASS